MSDAYIKLNQISAVQVGITSNCNLMCSGCPRVDASGTSLNSNLPLGDMNMDTFKLFFGHDFVKRLIRVEYCPVFGDPVASRILLESLLYLQSINSKLIIEIHTNGSLHSETFWRNLSDILKGFENSEVRFSIDGIGDVHSFYRRNSSYSKLITNVKAFISHGGNATWQFISFDHNQHQIEDARETAKEMGFGAFLLRRNGSRELTPSELNTRPHHELKIEDLPSPLSLSKLQSMSEGAKVQCEWRSRRMLYFCFTGEVWPCCFLANSRFASDRELNEYFKTKVLLRFPLGFNNIQNHSLEEILLSQWFQSDLVQSWSHSVYDQCNPLLVRCVQKCGRRNGLATHQRTKL